MLTQQARITDSYWIPYGINTGNEEEELEVHAAHYISEVALLPIHPTQLELPLRMEDLLPNLEQTYAMSLRVYANSLVANTAQSKVVERLAKVPPTFDRNGHPIYNRWWRFESRLPDKRKRVAFHKLWKNDALVMAYGQRQSVTQGHPAQGQVRSISHIYSHVYLVTVSLTENNSEAAGDNWYHISEENALAYLRVFPQIRRVERWAEIWGSHAPQH